MAISEEDRFYGQLIVDFANANSTDEAGDKYFENVQKVFGFSHQFADHAKAAFPSLAVFRSTLTEAEKKCCGLISEIKMLELHIASAIIATSIKYNVYLKKFHVKINVDEGTEPVGRDLTIKQMGKILRTCNPNSDSEKYNEKVLSHSLPKLLACGEQILAIEGMSRERYGQMSEREAAYDDVQKEHGYIARIQEDLRSLLPEIIKPESRGNSKVISEILLGYNNRNRISEHLQKTIVIDHKIFDEAYYLDRDDSDFLYKIYYPAIDFCVNEFLEVIENIEYLKKCELCRKFYIAKKLIRTQKRCPICSKKTRITQKERADYMKKYRQRQKREAEIEKLTKEGYTRLEAVDYLRKESKPTKTP